MSIDDRIRRGLASNAALPAPPVESHLDAVRRRHRRRVRVRVAGAVLAALLLAITPWWALASLDGPDQEPAAPGVPALAGTYRVQVLGSGETQAMSGSWVVVLTASGEISLRPPPGYDGPQAGAGATYSHEDGRFTTNLFVGWPGCQRTSSQVGVYRTAVSAATLRFSLVTDSCAPRLRLFGATWEREP